MKLLTEKIDRKVDGQVRDQAQNEIRTQAWYQVRDQAQNEIRTQAWYQVRDQVK